MDLSEHLAHALSRPLTRREFLKASLWGCAGLAVAAALPVRFAHAQDAPVGLGRVAEASIDLHEQPNLDSKKLKKLWRDVVSPITEIRVGGELPAHNRIWYNLGGEGYAHSGAIQPVQIVTQTPSNDIPEGGRLGEVTVPFTDTRWFNKPDSYVAYRLYYQTTHWVGALVHDSAGAPWYQLIDDKLETVYYANANHLRLVPYAELAPLSPDIPPELKRIEVRLEPQILIAYELERPVFMARVATGAQYSNGDYRTPTGHHMTLSKRASRHMAAGDRAAANSYDLPGVPWICYFDENGTALHGTYWHNDYGRPRSHGCVNLTPTAARWLFRWTLPSVGATELKHFEPVGTVVDIF